MIVLKTLLDQLETVLWQQIFVVSVMMSVAVDPFFFYTFVLNENDKCMCVEGNLRYIVSVLRTLLDLPNTLRIILFRKAFIVPTSSSTIAFGRKQLIQYVLFTVDILSIVPAPQVAILLSLDLFVAKRTLLTLIIILNIGLRVLRFSSLLYFDVLKTSNLFKTTWIGYILKILMYILGGHVFGGLWYYLSILSKMSCWSEEMKRGSIYDDFYLACGNLNQTVLHLLNNTCSLATNDRSSFKFGIYADAIASGVLESTTSYCQKFLFCFWWGLRQLNAVATKLQTSMNVGEIVFAMAIGFYAMGVLSFLLRDMQKYISQTIRAKDMSARRRVIEQWIPHHMLADRQSQIISVPPPNEMPNQQTSVPSLRTRPSSSFFIWASSS